MPNPAWCVAEVIAQGQSNTPQNQASSSPASGAYLVIVLTVTVLALVAVIFIRTSMRRASKR
jgi:hypothetical protein